jgi:hypothetical protein
VCADADLGWSHAQHTLRICLGAPGVDIARRALQSALQSAADLAVGDSLGACKRVVVRVRLSPRFFCRSSWTQRWRSGRTPRCCCRLSAPQPGFYAQLVQHWWWRRMLCPVFGSRCPTPFRFGVRTMLSGSRRIVDDVCFFVCEAPASCLHPACLIMMTELIVSAHRQIKNPRWARVRFADQSRHKCRCFEQWPQLRIHKIHFLSDALDEKVMYATTHVQQAKQAQWCGPLRCYDGKRIA